jgi:sRNA-binding protein
MQSWTRDPAYLAACTRGAARINLDGVAVGSVSEAEAMFAATELQRVRNLRRSQLKVVSNETEKD